MNAEERQYAIDQKAWVKETGLEIGDKVKVIAKAEDRQAGWPTAWITDMDEVSEATVLAIHQHGIKLAPPGCYFPFFVLVKL